VLCITKYTTMAIKVSLHPTCKIRHP
jgi:hypothetical protein